MEPDNGQGNNTGALVDKEIDTQTFSGRVSWNPMGSEFLNFNLVPYFTQTSVDWTDPNSGRIVSSDVDTIGIKADNRIPFTSDMVLGIFTFGGEWYSDEHDGGDSTTIDGERPGVPDGENNFFGLFAQVEATFENPLGLPGNLTFIPGVRWDSFESSSPGQVGTEDDVFSPKLAVSYEPAPWFVLFGSYAQAFRAPGINELYLQGTHFVIPLGPGANWTNTFMPNPNLKPEHAKTFEFGAGLNFYDVVGEGDNFRFKAAYHTSQVDDLINLYVIMPPGPPATCFFPPNVPCSAGTATSQNVDAHIRGVEIESGYENNRIALDLNYSTLDGHERGTIFDISSLPPSRFNATFVVKIPKVDASLGIRAETGGEVDRLYNPASHSPDTEHRDEYSVVDVFASWRPLGSALEGLRVDVGVDNVGDTAYVRTAEGVFEAGRNYKAAISFKAGW